MATATDLGSGTVADPYQIDTAERLVDLLWNHGGTDAYFIVTACIDMVDSQQLAPAVSSHSLPEWHAKIDCDGYLITNLDLMLIRPAVDCYGYLSNGSFINCVVEPKYEIGGEITSWGRLPPMQNCYISVAELPYEANWSAVSSSNTATKKNIVITPLAYRLNANCIWDRLAQNGGAIRHFGETESALVASAVTDGQLPDGLDPAIWSATTRAPVIANSNVGRIFGTVSAACCVTAIIAGDSAGRLVAIDRTSGTFEFLAPVNVDVLVCAYGESGITAAPATDYLAGSLVTPPVQNGYNYRCIQPGQTSAKLPKSPWPVGSAISIGTAVFAPERQLAPAVAKVTATPFGQATPADLTLEPVLNPAADPRAVPIGTGVGRVAGSITVRNAPAEIDVALMRSGREIKRQISLDGKYAFSTSDLADYYVIAYPNNGISYEGGIYVTEGQVIVPSAGDTGYSYRVILPGYLPAAEPEWWSNGSRVLDGGVRLEATKKIRPQAKGPITPHEY